MESRFRAAPAFSILAPAARAMGAEGCFEGGGSGATEVANVVSAAGVIDGAGVANAASASGAAGAGVGEARRTARQGTQPSPKQSARESFAGQGASRYPIPQPKFL